MVMWLPIVLFLLIGAGPAERCSMRMLLTERPASGSVILARALADTVDASAPAANFLPSRFAPVGVAEVAAWGQRFEVLEVTGTAVGLDRGGEFVAVPWRYRDDCSPEAWDESVLWVEPGTDVLFSVSPTRVPGSGEPTIDVFGWITPYPSAPLLKYAGSGPAREDRGMWLSAREYYDLLTALPAGTWWVDPDRASVLAAVEAAFARSGRYATTFPGTEILALYRRWAATGREE